MDVHCEVTEDASCLQTPRQSASLKHLNTQNLKNMKRIVSVSTLIQNICCRFITFLGTLLPPAAQMAGFA